MVICRSRRSSKGEDGHNEDVTHKPCSCKKTRLIVLSYDIKILAVWSFVLSQSTRKKDR